MAAIFLPDHPLSTRKCSNDAGGTPLCYARVRVCWVGRPVSIQQAVMILIRETAFSISFCFLPLSCVRSTTVRDFKTTTRGLFNFRHV
jgi:hypothetical protein